MIQKVILGRRGAMTLPAKLRKRYDLKENDELIVEETQEGLLLRPSVTMPVELYTEERIAEFAADDEAIGQALKQLEK